MNQWSCVSKVEKQTLEKRGLVREKRGKEREMFGAKEVVSVHSFSSTERNQMH